MQMTLQLTKPTQHDRILQSLSSGEWVECFKLVYDSRCLAYTGRITELRQKGYTIENKTETVNGEKHGWYRWVK